MIGLTEEVSSEHCKSSALSHFTNASHDTGTKTKTLDSGEINRKEFGFCKDFLKNRVGLIRGCDKSADKIPSGILFVGTAEGYVGIHKGRKK